MACHMFRGSLYVFTSGLFQVLVIWYQLLMPQNYLGGTSYLSISRVSIWSLLISPAYAEDCQMSKLPLLLAFSLFLLLCSPLAASQCYFGTCGLSWPWLTYHIRCVSENSWCAISWAQTWPVSVLPIIPPPPLSLQGTWYLHSSANAINSGFSFLLSCQTA